MYRLIDAESKQKFLMIPAYFRIEILVNRNYIVLYGAKGLKDNFTLSFKSFCMFLKFIYLHRIIQLKDAGIIDHLIQAERNQIFGYENMSKILHSSKSKTNTSPINLEHLQGGFILFCLGCAVSVTCFVFEVITGLYSSRKL